MLNTDPKNITKKLTHAFVALALVILGTRLAFSLLSADLTNTFVRWVYETSVPLMQPFRGIFSPEISGTGHVLELPVLFAMVAYALLGAIVFGLVAWLPVAKSKK